MTAAEDVWVCACVAVSPTSHHPARESNGACMAFLETFLALEASLHRPNIATQGPPRPSVRPPPPPRGPTISAGVTYDARGYTVDNRRNTQRARAEETERPSDVMSLAQAAMIVTSVCHGLIVKPKSTGGPHFPSILVGIYSLVRMCECKR